MRVAPGSSRAGTGLAANDCAMGNRHIYCLTGVTFTTMLHGQITTLYTPDTSMKPVHLHTLLLGLVLTALVLMPFVAFTAPPEPQPAAHEQVSPATADTTAPEDLPSLRHRYRHDATGVRARLGMCRRGHGGPHGNGQRVDEEAGRGPGRGRHHRCPLDAPPQENTP